MGREQQFVHFDIRTARTPGAFGSPEEYVQAANRNRMDRIGVADREITTWVEWERACKKAGTIPTFGYEAEYTTDIDRRKRRVTLLVQKPQGFHSLTRLAAKTYELAVQKKSFINR